QLCRVLGAGEAHQRRGDIHAGDLRVSATELAEHLALLLELLGLAVREATRGTHVDAHELTVQPAGHACAPTEQPLTVRCAAHRDDDSFLRLPRLADA